MITLKGSILSLAEKEVKYKIRTMREGEPVREGRKASSTALTRSANQHEQN